MSLGGNTTNRVSATGLLLKYQWHLNGAPVFGQTNASVVLTNLQVADLGDYTVVVTNLAGSVTSQVATLTVDPTFTRITTGPVVTDIGIWLCPSWWDYDNDGFLDLVITCGDVGDGQNLVYRNNGNGNHWLKLKLVGTASDRWAIGAKVRVEATIRGRAVWQMREISGNSTGSGGGGGLPAHFGLGDATNAHLIRIEWPSGIVRELGNVTANQLLPVSEPARLEMMQAGELRIQWWKGQAFDLEASINLSTWTRIISLTNLTGRLTFTDREAAQHSHRFYWASGK